MQSIILRNDVDDEVAPFMRQQFAERFNADLKVAAGELYGAYQGQEIVGAFGLRSARDGLASSVYCASALSNRLSGVPAPEVAEVVHLCGRDARSVLRILPCMAGMIEQRGFQLLVFTATRCLRQLFAHRGWQLDDLGPAEICALQPAERVRWGGYYESLPRVLVGSVADAAVLAQTVPSRELS